MTDTNIDTDTGATGGMGGGEAASTAAPEDPGHPPGRPSGSSPVDVQQHLVALRAVHEELSRVAAALHHGADTAWDGVERVRHGVGATLHHAAQSTAQHCPAWLRPTAGENRWPVAGAILVAILLQLALPDRLSLLNRWVLPILELALLIALLIAVPHRFHKRSRPLRAASLTLTALLTLANGWSAALLVIGLVAGTEGEDAAPLLAAGAAIWLTNVIAFALWYWQFDRGGPAARAHAKRTLPDFQFVQMQTPDLAHPEWEPGFVDYLYLSFTNATAFSPTDVMPLSRWAKLTMLAQSLVSLITVALVIARAVNILK